MKTEQSFENFEELYKSIAHPALVNNDSFLIKFDMDFKLKNGQRVEASEYGFYKVHDSKVIEEYFYFI